MYAARPISAAAPAVALTSLCSLTPTPHLGPCACFAVKGKRVGVCVSGGLDSKTVCKRLVEEGIDVLAFSADLGQPDETDINNVKVRMATCGVETVIIDLKDEMAEACFDTLQAQARYDGGYWNTTGIGRYVTCRGLVTAMQKNKVDVLAHGATGRGNDQMRFERYTNVLAPKMQVYAPWRDAGLLEEFPGRTEMAAYLNGFGIEAFVGPKKKYSTDANLAGLSHEAEDLESVETSMLIVDPEMGCWPKDAPDKVENVVFSFVGARCVAINGKKMNPQVSGREARGYMKNRGVAWPWLSGAASPATCHRQHLLVDAALSSSPPPPPPSPCLYPCPLTLDRRSSARPTPSAGATASACRTRWRTASSGPSPAACTRRRAWSSSARR